MSKHTPGPWKARGCAPYSDEWEIRSADCATIGFAPIAKVMGDRRKVDTATREANAQLISAAPELLQVAIEMLELADNWPGVAYAAELETRVRVAIAKATCTQEDA